MDGLTLTAGMLVMATLALGIFVAQTGTFYTPDLTLGRAEGVIGLQIVASSIGYLLFFEIIRLAGPVFFSQIGYVITISGTGWGANSDLPIRPLLTKLPGAPWPVKTASGPCSSRLP